MSVPLFSLGASYLSGCLQTYVANRSNSQAAKSQFQQLGQDLQAGDLTQAQQDFNALTKDLNGHQINSVLSRDFSALGQALQSGNLSSAQQAYSVIQQVLQQFGLNTGPASRSIAAQPTGGTINMTA